MTASFKDSGNGRRGGLIHRLFAAHPAEVGEGYSEHALAASRYGFRLIGAGLMALTHALVPALFKTRVSEEIFSMADELRARRGGEPHSKA
ncbi:DUF6356 family protein [Brevundimonas sp. 2R-24]|uniref:DUF6356 family protein n=1 Tax=Peiella sedimenti TaxID=3061083 RepID=A0ABT8SPB5_9CAUL|nr:DUF6356 family protein [Caulobacteraceae bacterium XZ-24]